MIICCQDSKAPEKGPYRILTSIDIAAILGAVAKKAVTGVAEPS